jgi:hypothetical protein
LPTPIDFPARSSRPIVRTDVDDATPPVAAKSESAPRRKASVAATSTDTAAMQGAGL